MDKPQSTYLLYWRALYCSTILFVSIVATHWIAWFSVVLGGLYGLFFAYVAFELKFGKLKFLHNTEDLESDDRNDPTGITIKAIMLGGLTWVIAQGNYNWAFISRYGIEKQGVVTEIKKQLAAYPGGYASFEPYATVTGYPDPIRSWQGEKVGDTVYYLFSPQLPSWSPTLYPTQQPKLKIILSYGGMFLFTSFIFAFTLLTTWFFSLFRAGFPLVAQKIESDKQKEIKKEVGNGVPDTEARAKRRLILHVLNHLYYWVGCAVFALFVLVLLKNLYWNIPFKYTSIVATSIAVVLIFATPWGERLFTFSNHILLSTNYYRLYSVIKQTAKILLYLKFGQLLLQSLTQGSKSFGEVLLEFVNRFFEMNIKSLWDFFVALIK